MAFYQPPIPTIDGDFDEWSKAQMFGMYVPASGSSIAVEEWSVRNYGGSLFMYLNVEGTLMSTTSVDSFYLFVDADHDSDTGYSVSDMGADYLLVLDGWGQEVKTASVMRYDSTTDLFDWNKWASSFNIYGRSWNVNTWVLTPIGARPGARVVRKRAFTFLSLVESRPAERRAVTSHSMTAATIPP